MLNKMKYTKSEKVIQLKFGQLLKFPKKSTLLYNKGFGVVTPVKKMIGGK